MCTEQIRAIRVIRVIRVLTCSNSNGRGELEKQIPALRARMTVGNDRRARG